MKVIVDVPYSKPARQEWNIEHCLFGGSLDQLGRMEELENRIGECENIIVKLVESLPVKERLKVVNEFLSFRGKAVSFK